MRSNQGHQVQDRQTYPVAIIPKVFFTDFRPSANAIVVYVALKLHDRNPSIPTMAKMAGISVSSFQRGTAELVKKGLLQVHQRTRETPGGNRRPVTNVYEIMDLDIWGEKEA